MAINQINKNKINIYGTKCYLKESTKTQVSKNVVAWPLTIIQGVPLRSGYRATADSPEQDETI